MPDSFSTIFRYYDRQQQGTNKITANMTATTVDEKFKQFNSKTGAETAALWKKTMTEAQKPKQTDVAGAERCEQCGVELRSGSGLGYGSKSDVRD